MMEHLESLGVHALYELWMREREREREREGGGGGEKRGVIIVRLQ